MTRRRYYIQRGVYHQRISPLHYWWHQTFQPGTFALLGWLLAAILAYGGIIVSMDAAVRRIDPAMFAPKVWQETGRKRGALKQYQHKVSREVRWAAQEPEEQ